MNFSPEYAFSSPIKIGKFNLTQSESGKRIQNLDTLSYQESHEKPTIDLKFLPEGGTFIYGIKQRVAFDARTSTGRGKEVTGQITNQNGIRVMDFRSAQDGPGVVEFTPVQGDTYFATVNNEKFKGLKWQLPYPEDSGVALRVNNTGDGLINIILKGRKIEEISYMLTLTMNNVLVFAEDVRVDTIYNKKLQTDKLPSGTAYISLYDHKLNLVAERLILINNYKKLNIKIETSSSFVNPGGETELTLSTTDEKGNKISSLLSVAVIDSASGYCISIPPSQIEYTYLYDRSFYENLPFQIRSRGLRNFDLGSIDAMLMAFGSRKYSSEKIAEGPENEFVNYDCLKICNPDLPLHGRSVMNMITDASPDVISLKSNNKGEAIISLDSLDPNVRQIMIMPDNITSKAINPIKFEFPSNMDFIKQAKLLANFTVDTNNDLPFTSELQQGINGDDNIPTETNIINNTLFKDESKEYSDYHSTMYQSSGAITVYGKDFISASTLQDIIYRSNPYKIVTTSISTGVTGKQVYLRNAPNSIIGHGSSDDAGGALPIQPALIVLDNNPIGTTYESIADMPASGIASVTFLRGTQGFTMYGTKAIGGVVFISTKFGHEFTENELSVNDKVKRNDNIFKQVRLFRTENEFYIPTKEETAFDQKYQFRSTLLWKDHVVVDDSGKITIKYPNNLIRGTAFIIVNGISISNLIGSETYTYKIH